MTEVFEDRPDIGRGARAGTPGRISPVDRAAFEVEPSLRLACVSALVSGAREGDAGAWAELVDRFSGTISAIGRSYHLPPADISELQQTTWLRLVENLHRIEEPERVGAWLASTARRESLELLKKAAKYCVRADRATANLPDHRLPEPDAARLLRSRLAHPSATSRSLAGRSLAGRSLEGRAGHGRLKPSRPKER